MLKRREKAWKASRYGFRKAEGKLGACSFVPVNEKETDPSVGKLTEKGVRNKGGCLSLKRENGGKRLRKKTGNAWPPKKDGGAGSNRQKVGARGSTEGKTGAFLLGGDGESSGLLKQHWPAEGRKKRECQGKEENQGKRAYLTGRESDVRVIFSFREGRKEK